MSIAPTSTLDGVQLYQCSYSDDSNYLDEWEISINSYYLGFYGNGDNDPSMPALLSTCVGYMSNNSGMPGQGTVSPHISSFLSYMEWSSVVATISHGNWDHITIDGGTLYKYAFDSIPDSKFDFVKLYVICACYCGDTSNGECFVDKCYSKGIDCVIGFNVEIYQSDGRSWTSAFLNQISLSCSISNSMSAADNYLENNCTPAYGTSFSTERNNRYVLGDTSEVVIPH